MSTKPQTKTLRFPSMGVVRRNVQERVASAVSYPTPWALNVRHEGALTNRLRGGSFTGIAAGSRPSTIVYRDRLLEIDSTNANAVRASRLGNHADFSFTGDLSDTLRPTLFQFSEADAVGEDVVALVPHKDASLLGFTAGETWVQQGDPLTGPRLRVSDQVGIIGADAWCVNHDTVYFLSSQGLYSVGANGDGLQALSEDKVPEDLTSVSDSTATLTYNHADRGVYIHLAASTDWFYDTERDQFWPFNRSESGSHLLVGPVRLGGPNQYGMLQTLVGIMASGSAAVNWRVVTGETAEEACANGKAAITADLAGSAYDEYVEASGAWDAGRSDTAWPRVSAAWAVLWLSSAGTWAYEAINMETMPFGRHR